jgi:hypothetical protein
MAAARDFPRRPDSIGVNGWGRPPAIERAGCLAEFHRISTGYSRAANSKSNIFLDLCKALKLYCNIGFHGAEQSAAAKIFHFAQRRRLIHRERDGGG